ncbi:cobalamin biosynthesis bifunctional protein CbiET, partial [Phocaeicola vulgatus]
MQTFYIIGISDNRNQFLSPEIRNLVSQGKVFSGGKRHHELVHAYLPEDAVWIDI